jgi:hypothetical protein
MRDECQINTYIFLKLFVGFYLETRSKYLVLVY